MQAHGLERNVISYNAAISACEKGSQWQEALELLAEMQAQGLEPNVISYSAAISACEKGEQWEKSLFLLTIMPQSILQPCVICYQSAVLACSKAFQWRQSLQLFQDMVNLNMLKVQVPNDVLKVTYSLVMLNVEQQGLVSHEIFLLQTLGKSSNAGELAETAAVSRLVAEGQIEEAGKLLRDFAHSHWSPASELLAATCNHSFHKPRTPLHIQHAQGGAYWKEVRLLHYVFEHASRGCGASVCDAMDSFAETSWAATRQWSKIAGRLKAALLESSLRGTAAEVALLEMGTSLLAKFTVDCLVCL